MLRDFCPYRLPMGCLMPGDVPLDGSPDPVGPEPDPYDEDEERQKRNWEALRTEQVDARRKRGFDPATDSYSEWRYDDYLDWVADHSENRLRFIECSECGLALNETNYPSARADRDGVCFGCLGTSIEDRQPETIAEPATQDPARRDPTPTLEATRPLNFEIELQLPIDSADPESRTWQLMDSPLRDYGIAFFTSGLLGLIIEESSQPEPLEQYQPTDWSRSYVTVTSRTQDIIKDLGFTRPVRTGVSIHLNIPWRPAEHRWRFLILGR